jgi:hypothetical protein
VAPKHRETLAWYVDLWRRIEADDVYVCYREKNRGEGGYFEHDGDAVPPLGNGPWRRRPKIALCRFPRPQPDDAPADLADTGALESELLTLCHEYGHCVSFRGATDRATWERYHEAAKLRDKTEDDLPVGQHIPTAIYKALSNDQRALIVAEETVAWTLGRSHVPEQLLAAYEETARRGVHLHRVNMGMEEPWPDDPRA